MMPARTIPIVTGEIYHICNKGIDHKLTFTNRREYRRATALIEFYRRKTGIKYSKFILKTESEQKKIFENIIKKNAAMVDILSFCFMPTHFHFLLKQTADEGITYFISQFENSYTRYFNTKHERVGPLFLDQFKSIRIETDEQFLHVQRYIHLNPYSSYVVKKVEDLEKYEWSSFPEYLGISNTNICSKELIFSFFKDVETYKKFVFDQADYQRKLEMIKHLTLE